MEKSVKPKVLVTRLIHDDALALLRAACAVTINPHDRSPTRGDLLDWVRDCDGAVTLLLERVDREFFEAAGPRLRVVANMAVGIDNIDLPEATRRGVYVANTPDVLTDATAECAWALILAVARRIVEADRYVREGRFKAWSPSLFMGTELKGRTLGIVGAGRIGQAVARRAAAFEVRVLYTSRARKPAFESVTGASWGDLDALLGGSDIVVLTVPLTPETRHLIGWKELSRMKRSAILINIARGPVVDEEALARALREGAIAGAGLDVYENEPAVHPDLLRSDAAVLLPHIGSSTHDTRRRMAMMAAENCLAGVQGRVPPQALNAAAIPRR